MKPAIDREKCSETSEYDATLISNRTKNICGHNRNELEIKI